MYAHLHSLIIARMDERFEYDELVFDGLITKVHKVGLRMPDGHVVQRDLIHYPGAVVVLPVCDDGSIVLIRNRRFAVREDLYELPAGLLDDGEDPAKCAARELAEETGYTAGRIEKLGGFYSTPGTSNGYLHAFLAAGLTDGPQDLETYEQITVELVRDDEVRRMVSDGRLHDAKSLATLALYWLKKGFLSKGS